MSRYYIYPDDHLADATRAELLAWMASERSDLLAQLTGLDERILCQQPVIGDWTAKDLLAHVAHWDAFFTQSVKLALAGRAGEVADVSMDERNAAMHAERQAWPLDVVLNELAAARAAFLEVFNAAPGDALDIEWQFGWGRATLRRIARWRGYHDSEHATQIEAWRATLGK
jgi:DinB superfamily